MCPAFYRDYLFSHVELNTLAIRWGAGETCTFSDVHLLIYGGDQRKLDITTVVNCIIGVFYLAPDLIPSHSMPCIEYFIGSEDYFISVQSQNQPVASANRDKQEVRLDASFPVKSVGTPQQSKTFHSFMAHFSFTPSTSKVEKTAGPDSSEFSSRTNAPWIMEEDPTTLNNWAIVFSIFLIFGSSWKKILQLWIMEEIKF